MISVWEKIRRWVDGERDSIQAEQALQDSKNSGQSKSKSELFLQKLKEQLEATLKEEVTRIPNTKKAYIPQRFIVFISSSEEKSLPKAKREFFEENLSALILETAKEIAGQLQLSAKTIKVEVRVNPTLEADEIEVQSFPDNLDKTSEISLEKSFDWKTSPENQKTIEDLRTIDDENFGFTPLYYLEIWRNEKKENEFPVIKREISIGRDYSGSKAHIRLQTENRNISGQHATIFYKENGEISVTSLHKNPTKVAGKVITKDETATLSKNNEIQIYDFTLRLKFPEK